MNKDLQILKKRYLDNLLSRDFNDADKLEEIRSSVIDGTYDDSVRFSDVDYESTDGASWQLPGHLGKALDLAIIAARANRDTASEAKELFLRALNEWIRLDFISRNWWYNEIAVAGMMTDIGIVAWDMLNDEQKLRVHLIGSRGSFRYNYTAKKWTGANQLWGTEIAAKHAVMLDDSAYMWEIADRMYGEIAFGKEGIQTDGSYFQHGPRLYAGGYGRNFLSSLSGMLGKFDGTPFELPPERVDVLELFILDGLRWMIHKDMFDWTACGREFSRPGWGGAGIIAGAVDKLCELNAIKRKDELKAFSASITEKRPAVQGVKYFPKSTLMCAHIDDVYIGFKGIDPCGVAGETCNGEYHYCANVSYGTTTTVMRTGEEYDTMSAVWNFCRIPGTTTRDETDEELLSHATDCNTFQEGDRFDGGQLGDCAWSAQTVSHHGITATVVAFGTPLGVAILGSGISSDVDGEKLTTTVEQCRRMTEVEGGDDLVRHNGVEYVNLDSKNKFVVTAETREGSWKHNNLGMDDTPVTADVVTVELDRGHDGYAYVIRPDTQSGRFEVVENTADIQAVRLPDGRVIAHFFAEGDITIDGKKVSGRMHDCLIVQPRA